MSIRPTKKLVIDTGFDQYRVEGAEGITSATPSIIYIGKAGSVNLISTEWYDSKSWKITTTGTADPVLSQETVDATHLEGHLKTADGTDHDLRNQNTALAEYYIESPDMPMVFIKSDDTTNYGAFVTTVSKDSAGTNHTIWRIGVMLEFLTGTVSDAVSNITLYCFSAMDPNYVPSDSFHLTMYNDSAETVYCSAETPLVLSGRDGDTSGVNTSDFAFCSQGYKKKMTTSILETGSIASQNVSIVEQEVVTMITPSLDRFQCHLPHLYIGDDYDQEPDTSTACEARGGTWTVVPGGTPDYCTGHSYTITYGQSQVLYITASDYD